MSRRPCFNGFGFETNMKSLRAYLQKYSFMIEVQKDEQKDGKITLALHEGVLKHWNRDNELGFYFMVKNDEVVYVGHTNRNLLTRQQEHFTFETSCSRP